MNRYLLLLVLITVPSCTTSYYLNQYGYVRPKHPNFYLENEALDMNDSLLVNRKFYSLERIGYSEYSFVHYYFLSGGTFLTGGGYSQDMELIVKDIKREYNLETAPSVGRYTLINNQLELEFFSPSGGGHYTKKKGYVRNDTIFLTKEFSRLYFGFYSQSLLRSKLIIMSEYQNDIQINN